jgi:hypothetical protein
MMCMYLRVAWKCGCGCGCWCGLYGVYLLVHGVVSLTSIHVAGETNSLFLSRRVMEV